MESKLYKVLKPAEYASLDNVSKFKLVARQVTPDTYKIIGSPDGLHYLETVDADTFMKLRAMVGDEEAILATTEGFEDVRELIPVF